MSLAFAKDASEDLFNTIYDNLMVKAKQENLAIADQNLSKMNEKQKRKALNKGMHCSGNWQALLNDWTLNRIENTFVLDYLKQEHLLYTPK